MILPPLPFVCPVGGTITFLIFCLGGMDEREVVGPSLVGVRLKFWSLVAKSIMGQT